VTSGGSAMGARPIFEQHCEVVEKCEVCDGDARVNAGTRKAGRIASPLFVGPKTDRRALLEPFRQMWLAIDDNLEVAAHSWSHSRSRP